MDTCKKPNMSSTSDFVNALKTGGFDLTKMNNVMTESCPMPNKGGSKRSKKGGRVLTFDNIKYLVDYFDKYLLNLSKNTLNSYLKSVSTH